MKHQLKRSAMAVLVTWSLCMVGMPVWQAAADDALPPLVPWPSSLDRGSGRLELSTRSGIVVTDATLAPLAEVLSGELFLVSGLQLATSRATARPGDIVLVLDKDLEGEAYRLEIGKGAIVRGGTYRAVAWGTATLLQAVMVEGRSVTLPGIMVSDAPAYPYRGVMLDLARRRHPVHTVEETIELLRLYKIPYLHLHLSDNQSFTFPSRAFPELPTPDWSYSEEELRGLVRYADSRGVTLVPEIDVPGHASWVARMPETFGTVDPATGRARSVGIVNMASEKAYQALDTLVGELCEMFPSSPYIHVGTDEVGAGGLRDLPEYGPYVARHGLNQAAAGQAGELFCHFIVRMDEIVRKHGRQTLAWSGFPPGGTPNAAISTNVAVMAWTGSPLELAERGYSLINCCWLPLYMVPPQGRAPGPERIYAWDAREFGRWDQTSPVSIPAEAPLLGAQICFWEQRHNEVWPILRPRVPALSERLWNPEAGRDWADFRTRFAVADRVAQAIIRPVRIEAKGLIDPEDVTFTDTLSIRLEPDRPGTVRYTLAKTWEDFPDADAPPATDALTLDETLTVSARLFDASGRPVGGVTQERFAKIVPSYRYQVLGPTPQQGWTRMPDFRELKVLRAGVTGLATADRVAQINRSMFAGLPGYGHIDVRVHGLYNPYTLQLDGQILVPADGEYTFQLRAQDGLAELDLGGRALAAVRVANRATSVSGPLRAGTYPFTIRYFYRHIFNDLNLQYRGPGMTTFVPFEQLVRPVAEWAEGAALSPLPATAVFFDPEQLANRSLATGRPVRVSGESQGDMTPELAVDGMVDNSSGWHCGSSPAWLEVDLGTVHDVGRVKVHLYYDGRRYYQYRIDASPDGEHWPRIVDRSANTTPSTREGDEHTFPAVRARYLRIHLLKNSANPGVHLNEIMVYGPE